MDGIMMEAVQRYLAQYGEMPTPRVYSQMMSMARFIGPRGNIQTIMNVADSESRYNMR